LQTFWKDLRSWGKSRCVKTKSRNHSWMCVTFNPSSGITWETVMPLCSLLPHGLCSTLEIHYHSTQSAASYGKVTWNFIMQEKGHISTGHELHSDGQKDSGHVFRGQMRKCFSYFWENSSGSTCQRCKRPSRLVYVMILGCISVHGMDGLHTFEGIIDENLPSRRCLFFPDSWHLALTKNWHRFLFLTADSATISIFHS